MKKAITPPYPLAANVVALDLRTPAGDPHPERIAYVRKWHIDQATIEPPSVCALHIAITTDHQIRTTGIALELEHADVLLAELSRIEGLLRARLAQHAPGGARVAFLRR